MERTSTFQYMLREISITDQIEIVKALLACDCMRVKEQRETVLNLLNGEFRGIGDRIERRSDNLTDVTEIVRTCLSYRGGLEKLVEIVIQFDRSTTSARNLSVLIHRIFLFCVIDEQLVDELITLLTQIQVTPEIMRFIYGRAILPDDNYNLSSFQQYDVVQKLSSTVRRLAESGWQSNNTHPLLTYIKRLSGYVSDSLRHELDLWQDQVLQKAPMGAIPNVGDDLSSHSVFFLLVTFQSDCNCQENEPERFYLRATLIREENGERIEEKRIDKDRDTEEKAYLLGDIPVLLNKWVCDSQAIIAPYYNSPFTIELFLPFKHLCSTTCDPHQWALKDTYGNSTPISRKYPLVVRSYNRAYEGDIMAWYAWKQNWLVCQSSKCCMRASESYGFDGESSAEPKPCILHKEGYDGQRKDLHEDLQEVGCLRMTFVPPHFDNTTEHIFKKMMGAGTSVALWPRLMDKNSDKGTLERAYCELLPNCNLSKLPEMMRELRYKSRRLPADHIANNITLFWDNPNRLPADSPYNEYFKFPEGQQP